ncbi:DUF1097 domain-containing protein [Ramlibacter sp. 2FC]|uniref:DUF1097 domain-containing protein n=1 Tax=Ramlibacter sp. 2FC TaxID=2502188 RepID=UPI0010F7367C|nr:DUF1097 domain-containing protein [Ramlibacter sp. 2FC]
MIRSYAIAGAIVASIATWEFLSFPGLLIWAALIGWAGLHHSGDSDGVVGRTLIAICFGTFLAWNVSIALLVNTTPLPMPLAAAALVAVVVPIIISLSKFQAFKIIPAVFYGFASAFAFLTQTPGKFDMGPLTSFGLDNVLIIVPASMTIGVVLGLIQRKIAALIFQANPHAEQTSA